MFVRVLGYRGLGYLLLGSMLGTFASSIIFEGSRLSGSDLFTLLSIITLGQAILAFAPEKFGSPESSMFAFFMADAALAMVLVRASGSSSSPFLVLFPLLTLAGAIVFRNTMAWIFSAVVFVFMLFAVGFGMAIVGNGLAILTTSFLGMYLIKALDMSGLALRQSEDARRRLENLQKAILANIPSGLMSVDSRGRVIQINGVGTKILGQPESRLLGMHVRELLPVISDEMLRLNTQVPTLDGGISLDSGVPRRSVKYAIGGETLDLGYSVTRLSDPEDGAPLGTLLVFQDLTLITRMEENMRMSEKLAAIGKLAAGIAHEIRNPLAGISGSAQLLMGNHQLNEEDYRLLSIIQRESTRLDALITEFLEYVKPPKAKLEAVLLHRIAEQVIESLKVNSKWTGLACEVKISPSAERELCASGDANKIIQGLINFILNAGQAGARRVELSIFSASSGPVMDILDDGKGIAPEHLPHLFEPFFTTKESGTGLGLAITYRSFEAMGARIKVESPMPSFTAKGGTLFRIEFKGV